MNGVSAANQIRYQSYCQLGGCLNTDLVAVQRNNGSYHYTTYHYIGVGQAYWKQDRQSGPGFDPEERDPLVRG